MDKVGQGRTRSDKVGQGRTRSAIYCVAFWLPCADFEGHNWDEARVLPLHKMGCILTAVSNFEVAFLLPCADFEGLNWDVARVLPGYGFGFGKTEFEPVPY